jgi:hypothetical protein
MKNLLTFGLLAWVSISTSCKKGEALNPIKLDEQTVITKQVHDSTYYVYPTGYTTANAFLAPINLGVPAYIEPHNDMVDKSFLQRVNNNLPDRTSLDEKDPEALAPVTVNTINITKSTDVYITFLSSNAGYRNTLAYYTYKTTDPPVNSTGGSDNGAIDKVTYIFPYAISQTSGGGLVAGNKVKLGTFSAGTTIGFVLIINGWTGININPQNIKYYSQDNLNPETVSNLKRHAVMLYDSDSDTYIIGFEWTNRQVAASDDDFNDEVFYVKSSQANSIASNKVALFNDIDQ